MKQYIREKEFLLLLALGVLYFFSPLFLGKTFFYGDLYTYFFGAKKFLASSLKAGQFPLWNPYLHGGQPFFANLNNGVLYPSGLLYTIFPLFTALNIDIVFHLIFCGAAAYLLARSLGFQPLAAFATGIVYGYCGYTLSLGNLYNRLLAAPYIPILLLCWHRFLQEQRNQKRWFVAAIIAACLQFFAGAPEITILSLGFILLWSLLYGYDGRPYPQLLLCWLMLVVWLIGLSAIQILPTAQLVSQSPRSMIDSYAVFTQFSISPKRLPELLLSGFLGSKVHLQNYWGSALEPTGTPFIWSLYLGFPVLALAIAGGLARTDDSKLLPRRLRIFLLLLSVASLLLSLGRFLPFYNLLYEVPLLRLFRYPAKFLNAAILPAALLTGWNVQRFAEQNWKSKRFLLIAMVFAFAFLIAAVVFSVSASLSSHLETFFFSKADQTITHGLSRSLRHLSLFSVLTILACRLAGKNPRYAVVLVAVISTDLLVSGMAVNSYLPRSIFLNEPPAARLVKEYLNGGRLYRPESKHAKLNASSDEISNGIVWDLQTLNWYTAAYYDIPLMYNASFETLESAEILQLKLLTANLSWEKRSKLLSTANVSLALTSESLSLPGWKFIGTIKNSSRTDFYLYQNQETTPRIGIFDSGAISRSTPQALKILFHPSFDPRRHVILESPGVHPRPCAVKRAYALTATTVTPSESSFLAESSCDAYISTAIPYYDGWKARIDGRPAALIRANAAFFAVFLPAGKHLVTFTYFPNALVAGAVVSILFLLALPFAANLIVRP